MKLYDLDVSGNCYKVRLYAALKQIPISLVAVDFYGGEHLREPLISMNPWGEIPVLEDEGIMLRDSQAILCYLAKKYGDDQRLPGDPREFAKVMSWLSVATNEVHHGLESVRLFHRFDVRLDEPLARTRSEGTLRVVNRHLAERRWLVGDRVTLADIALFPYIALAHEGHVDISPYPHVVRWVEGVKVLPGFITMPGLM